MSVRPCTVVSFDISVEQLAAGDTDDVDGCLRGLDARLWAALRAPVGALVVGGLHLDACLAVMATSRARWAQRATGALSVTVIDGDEVAVTGDGLVGEWGDCGPSLVFRPVSYDQARLLAVTSRSLDKAHSARAVLATPDELAAATLTLCGHDNWRPTAAEIGESGWDIDENAVIDVHRDVLTAWRGLTSAGGTPGGEVAQIALGLAADWSGSGAELVETAARIAR